MTFTLFTSISVHWMKVDILAYIINGNYIWFIIWNIIMQFQTEDPFRVQTIKLDTSVLNKSKCTCLLNLEAAWIGLTHVSTGTCLWGCSLSLMWFVHAIYPTKQLSHIEKKFTINSWWINAYVGEKWLMVKLVLNKTPWSEAGITNILWF